MKYLAPLNFSLLFFLCVMAYDSKEIKEWFDYKTEYGKVYTMHEDEKRMRLYFENKKIIDKHNFLYHNGFKTYKLAINKFTDWTLEELIRGRGPKIAHSRQSSSIDHLVNKEISGALPQSIDWRTRGAVTKVKDQGPCDNGDWAFSVTGVVEAQHFLKSGELVSLSEQNLIDCSSTSNTCDGGQLSQAFDYIKTRGINTEDSYPYIAKNGVCNYSSSAVGANISNYVWLPDYMKPGTEELVLKLAVGAIGPVAAHVYVSGEWRFYQKGIFYEEPCPKETKYLNHHVLIVGYGSENNSDYWLVKNSWGDGWGEGGYMKMARNRNNTCGIATDVFFCTL